MKIALVGSAGGHLTELEMIFKDPLQGHDVFFITEKTPRTRKMKRAYLLKPFSYNPLPFIPAFFKVLQILKKEKPKMIITSGAEIAVPVIVSAKILGIKTLFIDDTMRVKTPTLAGKFCYPFSDYFLVQYPEMKKYYGKRAIFKGGLA